jgi:hypothetical protein
MEQGIIMENSADGSAASSRDDDDLGVCQGQKQAAQRRRMLPWTTTL